MTPSRRGGEEQSPNALHREGAEEKDGAWLLSGGLCLPYWRPQACTWGSRPNYWQEEGGMMALRRVGGGICNEGHVCHQHKSVITAC